MCPSLQAYINIVHPLLFFGIQINALCSLSITVLSIQINVLQVFTMVMGEYEFTVNFINVDEQSYVAKLIFVVFVFDMSVALMNLVLGLAVSDIDELQRNSAVRRMIQESYTVMYIDGFMTSLASLSSCMTCLDRRITGPRTCGFKDVYFLDLVDLDPNSNNKLGVEVYMKETEYFPSTHAIVTNIAK